MFNTLKKEPIIQNNNYFIYKYFSLLVLLLFLRPIVSKLTL